MVVFLCASWEGRRDICHVNMSLVEIVTAENFNCQIRVEESTLRADFKRNKNPFTIFSFSCQNARFNKRGEVVTNFHKIFIKGEKRRQMVGNSIRIREGTSNQTLGGQIDKYD